jgi:uncharacterized delta-60 repeat protein
LDGIVYTDLGMWHDEATAVAVQRDGKIVVAGSADIVGLDWDFAVVRYNSDGSLDSTFGVGGIVVTDFGDNDHPVGLAIQSDGKIVVAGNGDNDDIYLARYEQDGSLDATFFGGAVTAGLDGSHRAAGLVLQPDGKIVVAGSFAAEGPRGAPHEFLALRFQTNGTLDPSFGNGGRVTGEGGNAGAVAVQADGKIVLAGSRGTQSVGCQPYDPCDSALALVRYNTDGSIDPSFGIGGRATTGRPGETNTARGVAIQPDGKIVVVGGRDTRPVAWSNFVAWRYNSNGSLDSSFGSSGEVVTDFGGEDEARAVALQSDGRIIAGGIGGASDPSLDPLHGWNYPAGFAVARYEPNGILDRSFGIGGKVLIDVGETSGAQALALQPDGNVVVAGRGGDLFRAFALVRLMGATSSTK